MRAFRRRRWDAVWAVLFASVALLVAGIGAGVGDREHITRIQIDAQLDPASGDLGVRELIDYDFGVTARHGIYRDIPDLAGDAPISVTSETAPDDVLVTDLGSQTRIRVGDPNRTISRLHRYDISFHLDGSAIVDQAAGQLAWEAIGTSWSVEMDEIDIVLTVPFQLSDVECGRTGTFQTTDCDIEQVGPGQVHIGLDSLSARTGLTVVAALGDPVAEPEETRTLAQPDVDDPGTGLIPPALLAGLAAIAGAIPAAMIVRRAGREQVWIGGPTDAAHGPAGSPSSEPPDPSRYQRLTEAELGELATTEFESPRGMSAVEGGVLVEERVLDRHQTAWLLECAIRDEVEIDTTDAEAVILRDGQAPNHTHSSQILGLMFAGRDSIDLSSHDEDFQAGWQRLEAELEGWRRDSDHWDPAYRRARTIAIGGGVALVIIGLVAAFAGGWQANRWGSLLWVAVAGGAVAGFGAAAATRSWELHVRTPQGSARWLQVESFRRFLHGSEAQHVEYAAERGLLRQYTAWAVALDETDAWTEAVEAAAAARPELQSTLGSQLAFAASAASISQATQVASTTPSSSGSGGGGGGGFSGGGGGGGGSW